MIKIGGLETFCGVLLDIFFHQSPTRRQNHIACGIQRQTLYIIGQSLQILQKMVRKQVRKDHQETP